MLSTPVLISMRMEDKIHHRMQYAVMNTHMCKADQERELTDEECEILDLPYGTKIVGEMSAR
jgi:hypothetical protein